MQRLPDRMPRRQAPPRAARVQSERSPAMSGFGSRMGAAARAQARSGAVKVTPSRPAIWANTAHQVIRAAACSARDEEAAGSNPAAPTMKVQVAA